MLQEMKSLNGKEGLINLLYLSKLLEIQALQELLKFRRNMELLKIKRLAVTCLSKEILPLPSNFTRAQPSAKKEADTRWCLMETTTT